MKQHDTSSKSIIKNIVSLVASALVLIAATFAWFTTGSTADVATVSADIEGVFVVDYYTAQIPDADVLWGMQDGELYVRDISAKSDTLLSQYVQNAADTAWMKANDEQISFYPGEFRIFKISFTAKVSHDYSVRLNDVVFTSDDPDAAADSIYTYGYAVCKDEDTVTTTTETTQTLRSVLYTDGVPGTSGTVATVHANLGDVVNVYYVIGIPGEDINSSHDAVRQSGASIRIGSIVVE
ncbi:MAG: hypothetical protein ACI4I5_05235 [Acutalibacteraceae bacterium]